MIRDRCPHCDSGDCKVQIRGRDFDAVGESFDIVVCRSCGLVRTSPFLEGAELDRWYGSEYYGFGSRKFQPGFESLLNAITKLRARRLLRRVPSPAGVPVRVLDIGCGRGTMLGAMSELGADCHGLERKGFNPEDGPHGVNMHFGPLREQSFKKSSFDLITLWHVLEHLEEPGSVLEELSALLSPGGLIVISVPNIDSLQARIFGANWFHLDLPRHLWHFSPRTLGDLSQAAGLEKVGTGRFSAEQDLFGSVQSLLNRLIPGPPNRLYRSMQRGNPYQLAVWLFVSGLFAPLALLETLVAALAARGATYTVFLRKTNRCSMASA